MTDININHPIVTRIGALRQRVRMVLALYGTGMVLATLLGGAMALVLADYLLHFQPALRIAAMVLGLVAICWVTYRKLVEPLSARLTDQFLASRVENVNRTLADELIAAVHFIREGASRHNILAAKAIESVEQQAAGLRFNDALDYRMVMRSLGIVVVLAAVIAAMAGLNPDLARRAWGRWTDPFGGHVWPKYTTVEIDWPGGVAPKVHPLGDPLVVRAKVTQGYYSGLKVWITSYTDTQAETSDLMTHQEKRVGNYEKSIDPIGDKMLYLHVTAADDREPTPINSAHIKLAPRPVVSRLVAHIVPPPYVRNLADPSKPAEAKMTDLLQEVGRAVKGSTVRLEIKSSKPLQANKQGEPDIVLMEAGRDAIMVLPGLKSKLLNPTTAELTFPARQSLDFRPIVRDTDGFENRVGGTARLDVVPDALPAVVVTEPRREVKVHPEAVQNIQVQATDDLGHGECFLQADAFDAKPGDKPRFTQPLTWGPQVADGSAMSITATASYEWDLKPLNLKPGDRLSFYALVRDNYAMPQGQGDTGEHFELMNGVVRHRLVKSTPLTLIVRSKEDLEGDIRKELTEIREQIKVLTKQQETTHQQTQAIQKAVEASGVATQEQKHQLSELTTAQGNEATRAMSIVGRVEQVTQMMKTNKMQDSALGKIAQETAAGMKDVGQNNMPKAASELGKAQDSAGKSKEASAAEQKNAAESTTASAGRAEEQQQKALSTMGKLVDQLGAAGDKEAHIAKLEDIIKKQQEVKDQLQKVAPQTIGKDPKDLTKEQKDTLENIQDKQDKLSKDTQNLQQGMEKTAKDIAKSDPAGAESLAKAAEAARNNSVSAAQSSAAKSAGQNQTAAAGNEMAKAMKGLQAMKEELEQENRRQLEQLARQLQELLDAINGLREREVAIKDETGKAGEAATKEALLPVGDRQGRLQGNTLAEAQRAESLKEGRPIAADVQNAAKAMGTAAAALYKGIQKDSLPPETEAIAALDKAIAKLEKQKRDVEDKLKDEDLAEFIKKYEAIKKGQEEVQTATNTVVAGKTPQTLERPDTMELGKQSVAQGDLSKRVTALSNHPKLKEFEVIVWINQQITEQMNESQNRLSKALIGKQLATAQQTAIDRLQDIIESLKEEKGKKNDFESEPNNPDGGPPPGGKQPKPPLIPPVAQLKLLKSQQLIVNTDTMNTQQQIDSSAGEAEKGQLKQQAEKLGEKQDKIKDIATKIVEKLKQ